MDLVDAETIDASFVPRRSPVASMELDGEVVLARSDLPFYRLDPIASLVWSCFDGSATAEAIARDLAIEFQAPTARVSDDVVALTRTLGQLCFLEGVSCGGGESPAVQPASSGTTPAATVGRHLVEPPSS